MIGETVMLLRRDKVIVYEADDGWRWRRRNGYNGQITATGAESYSRKRECVSMAMKINRRALFTVES